MRQSRWRQFSLQSLMVIVTIIAVVLGILTACETMLFGKSTGVLIPVVLLPIIFGLFFYFVWGESGLGIGVLIGLLHAVFTLAGLIAAYRPH